MKEVNVCCPFCKAENKINIPDEILSQKKFGIFKIEVPSGAACNMHRFIVFIDTKGEVRGYERIDVLMEQIIQEETTPSKERKDVTLGDVIQLVGTYATAHLMHAKIFGYPIFLVIDDQTQDITKLLHGVGRIIMPKNYRDSGPNIEAVNKNDFNIKNHQNAFVIDGKNNILNVPWNSKVKFELDIIKKALEIFSPLEQVKLLQRDIRSFIKRAESAKDIIAGDEKISKGDLIKKLARDLRIPKLTKQDLSLIHEFIEQRLS